MPEVSIIIRTKNEERWINGCLNSIFSQSFKNFEIILVDNKSNDKTIEKAKKFKIKDIVNLDEYYPGKALNEGIKKSSGNFIVAISAHCIPTNSQWLENLVNAIKEDNNYAGVYGRQQPMSFSSDTDKRDLTLVFGLDRKVQSKDNFFHNANSIIRKDCWAIENYDNNITNIEDRVWAQSMLKKGYKILYEPIASVFHYHGIHQEGDTERLHNVVKLIENIDIKYNTGKLNPDSLEICAVIPIKGNSSNIKDKKLIDYTIESVKSSKLIKQLIVSSDNELLNNYVESKGVDKAILRPKELSESHVNLEEVQKFTLKEMEKDSYYPDLILHLEETYPFRSNVDLDLMIEKLVSNNFDSVVLTKAENNWVWKENDIGIKRIDQGDIPRIYKNKILIGLHGLGVVTRPEFIRRGNLLGTKVGLLNSSHPLSNFEIRDKESIKIFEKLI